MDIVHEWMMQKKGGNLKSCYPAAAVEWTHKYRWNKT